MKRIDIKKVLEEHSDEILKIPGVIGIAEGRVKGVPCIRVFVLKKDEKSISQLPADFEGYKVVVEESGEFRALPDLNKST